MNFDIRATSVEGAFLIESKVFKDERGFFLETYNEKAFSDLGMSVKFVQDNYSSSKKGVLRGLHFQSQHSQGKLVKVIRGEVFDVAVDLREGSPTFKNWFGIVLSEENSQMLYIPEGFAHGFLVLSDSADFLYKCTDYYHPEFDCGIIWNDREINILWPLEKYGIREPILSSKDKSLKKVSEITIPFQYRKETT